MKSFQIFNLYKITVIELRRTGTAQDKGLIVPLNSNGESLQQIVQRAGISFIQSVTKLINKPVYSSIYIKCTIVLKGKVFSLQYLFLLISHRCEVSLLKIHYKMIHTTHHARTCFK